MVELAVTSVITTAVKDGNGGNGGIVLLGSANGQNGTPTSNRANGGISINGNLPAGCKIAQNGICRLK